MGLPTMTTDHRLFNHLRAQRSPMLLKNSIDVCHHLSNPLSPSDFFSPFIHYHNSIKTPYLPFGITLILTIPTILHLRCLCRRPRRMELPIFFNNNNVLFFVEVVGRSVLSVVSFFGSLCLPATFAAFTASAVSLVSRNRNISLVSMTRALVKHRWSPVLTFDILRTPRRSCLWVPRSTPPLNNHLLKTLRQGVYNNMEFSYGVVSHFTILTPRLAKRQVLRKVHRMLGIWVEGCLVRECLVSLRGSKNWLGFKGCIPASSHALRKLSSVYAYFRAGSNIL